MSTISNKFNGWSDNLLSVLLKNYGVGKSGYTVAAASAAGGGI